MQLNICISSCCDCINNYARARIHSLPIQNRDWISVVRCHTDAMSDNDLELDSKTKAVFDRKGYLVLKKISQGAFGKVYKAKRTQSGTLSAVKVMDISKMPPR